MSNLRYLLGARLSVRLAGALHRFAHRLVYNHEAWRVCNNCGSYFDARQGWRCDDCGHNNDPL